MKPEDEPVIVEQTFPVPLPRLWRAITDPDEMREWFFTELEDFRPEPGFHTEFDVHHDGKTYRHVWTITEVVPQEKIVYDWSYAGMPGRGHVVFELAETDDGGSRLKLTNTVSEAFPEDDPAFRRESAVEGWTYFINGRLPAFLTD